jgi:hypothetical protein
MEKNEQIVKQKQTKIWLSADDALEIIAGFHFLSSLFSLDSWRQTFLAQTFTTHVALEASSTHKSSLHATIF